MITKKGPEPFPPLTEAGGGGSRLLTRDVLADELPRRSGRDLADRLRAREMELVRKLRKYG